ncbi:MAG TPA: ABC transporter permease [Acidimicrobiales bacterium]|nr:ABC transporter permease [Acidimicrobiales bacterium]
MTDTAVRLTEARPTVQAARSAFVALLLRDLTVLRKEIGMFLGRTIMQPLLLIFVFTYVFPKIGQGIGGSGRAAEGFSTLLVGGVIASAMIFQGIQAVALPLVQDFGYTREIEDRVLAPLPVSALALEKVVAGAVQAIVAGLVVFPLALFVPATAVHLTVRPLYLVTLLPLGAVMSASLGLTVGTRVEPRQVPLVFSLLVIPMTFLGCVYYPWQTLDKIAWLKWVIVVNPLVYLSEGLRVALANGVPHMPVVAIYGAIIGFTAVLLRLGVDGFKRRILA